MFPSQPNRLNNVTELSTAVKQLKWGPRPPFSGFLPSLRQTLSSLDADLKSEFSRSSGYASWDVRELWESMLLFLEEFEVLEDVWLKSEILKNRAMAKKRSGARVYGAPHGRVLISIPSNAPIPLALILPLAFLRAGNSVVVCSSKPTRRLALALAGLLEAAAPDRLLLWNGSVRSAISTLLSARCLETVYFMGSSRAYVPLAAQCAEAGASLIFEGTGNGVAVVEPGLPNDIFCRSIRQILRSKTFCNGEMCSAPNAVTVHRSELDRFLEVFAEQADEFPLSHTISEMAAERWPWIQKNLQAGGFDPDTRSKKRVPILVPIDDLETSFQEELFCPALFLASYSDRSTLADQLRSIRHRLQLSIFAEYPESATDLIQQTCFARYTVNIVPTEQDPTLPWGNYGLSGNSRVEDFLAKGLRTVILEQGAPEKESAPEEEQHAQSGEH